MRLSRSLFSDFSEIFFTWNKVSEEAVYVLTIVYPKVASMMSTLTATDDDGVVHRFLTGVEDEDSLGRNNIMMDMFKIQN